MDEHRNLLELERDGWLALSTDGDAAAAFYAAVLADDVLMLLPGGMVIDDRDEVISAMRGEPWASFELTGERVHDLTEQSAVVAYRAKAERDGVEYEALFSSTYVRKDAGWKLSVHQQTPV